jgi:hypothetical protein
MGMQVKKFLDRIYRMQGMAARRRMNRDLRRFFRLI